MAANPKLLRTNASEVKSKKLTISIVGAGNLGSALAVSLRRAGYPIDELIVRGNAALRKTRSFAKQLGSRVVEVGRSTLHADIVWFCVPDGEIAAAALLLAGRAGWKRKIALHSSGVLTSDALDVLRQRGASIASVHPLMTFVHGSRKSMAGVPFAMEGDAVAVRVARRVVKDLRGEAFSICKEEKAVYHAWGTFASPLLTALLATTEHVAAAAGVKPKAVKSRMLPMLAQTLANYATFDASRAFSGPIIRGDVDTVKRHLSALRNIPAAREVYVALARAALEYLPAKNKSLLEAALKLG